jgi:hypothetical protein
MHSLSNAGAGGVVEGAAFIRILRFDLRLASACGRDDRVLSEIISGRNGGAIRTGSGWGSAMLSVAAARQTLNIYGSDYAVTSDGGD